MHFIGIVIECWVVDPHVDGFPSLSHNLFAALVYHNEMRTISSRIVIRLPMNINCTSHMTTVFLYFLGIYWIHKCRTDYGSLGGMICILCFT